MLRCSRSGRLYKNTEVRFSPNSPALPSDHTSSLSWQAASFTKMNILNYLANCIKAQSKFSRGNISLTENTRKGNQEASTASVSTVDPASAFNHCWDTLTAVPCSHPWPDNTVPMFPRDAGSGCIPQLAACWAERNWLLPCKEPKEKDQYLPKKRRSTTSRIIILSTQWSIYEEK